MTTRVLVPADTWSVVVDELDRVAPREGVLVPLVSLVRRPSAPHPCIPAGLAELEAVVVAHAVPVPPDLQRGSAVHVAALPGADAWLDARVDEAMRRMPALRAAAYLHSHPFATGDTRPSSPDVHGHMEPMRRAKEREGLLASFSLIACRAHGGGWILRAFACTADRPTVDLGVATVVDEAHPRVREARMPHARHRGLRGTLRRWRRAAAQAGLPSTVDDLMDGWVRLRIHARGRTLVALAGHASASVEHVFLVDGARPCAWPARLDAPTAMARLRGLDDGEVRDGAA